MRNACIIFVCEYGMHRSRTAELLFKPFFSCTRSCGVNPLSHRPCHATLLHDTTLILVMEDWHATRLPADVQKKTVSLSIPSLPFMHPRLINLLAERVPTALHTQGIITEREAAFITRTIRSNPRMQHLLQEESEEEKRKNES